MTPGRVSRRSLLAGAGLIAGSALAGDLIADHLRDAGTLAAATTPGMTLARVPGSGYVPDGIAGLAAAFPRAAVQLLDSPFRANQERNTSYLLFVDPDRLLHTFRLNYGLPSAARPCGGWERPQCEVRGHTTGHLLVGARPDVRRPGERGRPGQRSLHRGESGALPGAGPAGRLPRLATCRPSPRPSSTGWRPASPSGRRIT